MNLQFCLGTGIAFLVCVALLPSIRRIAVRFRLYDPAGPIKIHTSQVPRLGGVAIVLSLVLSLMVASLAFHRNVLPVAFYVALGIIWFVGLMDDLRTLSPYVKLGAQILSAIILWRADQNFSPVGNEVLSLILTIFAVVSFVNALNFLDGADGVAAGTSAIIAIGFVLTGVGASAPSQLLAFVVVGSCLGFLIFNFPPANIFMGDSGSTTIGFLLSFLTLDSIRMSPVPRTFVLSIILAGLPLADLGFAIVRRMRQRASLVMGDRRHMYDLLLLRKYSARQVALCCYAISIFFVAIAWVYSRLGPKTFSAAVALLCFIVAGAGAALGSFSAGTPDRPSAPASPAPR